MSGDRLKVRHRRTTHRPSPIRTRLVWDWREVWATVTVCALTCALLLVLLNMASDPGRLNVRQDDPSPTVSAVPLIPTPVMIDDVPACTDAIADAGGICRGEP